MIAVNMDSLIQDCFTVDKSVQGYWQLLTLDSLIQEVLL